MLQSEAGYIDARPPPPIRRNLLATRGRTIHWVNRYRNRWSANVWFTPDSDRGADVEYRPHLLARALVKLCETGERYKAMLQTRINREQKS